MGIFSRWFRKNQPEDYEQVLAALSHDIQKRQTHLSEIRLRERRSTLLFSLYALASWIGYVSLWYTGYLPHLTGKARNSGVEKFVEGLPVFVGPVIILFIRRIVQIYFTRQGDKEEKHLVTLRKQQRDKIEEIKKQTNYYSTRTLIERYDESTPGPGPDTALRRRIPVQANAPVTPPKQLSQQQATQQLTPLTPVSTNGQLPVGLQQQLSPLPQRPMPPPRKQWYDRLADAILGDDDISAGSVAARYALICQRCFVHNGLVKESVWETTQFVCRNCGCFNPSPQAIRQGRPSSSPRSSVSPKPTEDVFAPPLQQPNLAMGPHVETQTRGRSRPRASVESDDAPTVLMDVDADS